MHGFLSGDEKNSGLRVAEVFIPLSLMELAPSDCAEVSRGTVASRSREAQDR